MAIAIGQTQRTSSAFSTSDTVAFGTAPGASDLIVLGLYKESSSTVTIPSGFTRINSTYLNTGGNYQTTICYKYNDTGNSYAFSWTGNAVHQAWGITWSGCDSSTPIDVEGASWQEANFTGLTVTGVTTLTDNAVHLVCAWNSATNSASALSGYTLVYGDGQKEAIWYKTFTSAGATGNSSVDLGTEFWCQGISFALRPTGTADDGSRIYVLQRNLALDVMGRDFGMVRRTSI